MIFPEEKAHTVYKEFANTKYGKYLKKAARYDRFRPANYPVKYWGRLLGPDANNLRHMWHTIAVARWFVTTENTIQPRRLTQNDAILLGITAALHDQAEAIVGDIPYGHKTSNQHRKEVRVLRSHERDFEPHLKGATRILYRIGRDKIAFTDPRRNLPGAFKTIELIGFLENALHALRQIEHLNGKLPQKKASYLGITTDNDRVRAIIALERLVSEVLGSGVIEELIHYGNRFPSAHTYLRRHAYPINQGMRNIRANHFDWYDSMDPYALPGERAKRIKQFHRQKTVWKDWLR